ncbi:MAG: YbgC/FadM family acyl-CoA thioesterase [Hyphomicrobiaceae bacterium]|nr:YbgC/FadM family acyl-CoA thioesterase [Hyphomicrobiaceae bacterium]
MKTDQWPDIAGRIVSDETGQRHVLPVRVYFEDTDAGGIVYHASYVRFCERGRTDFLRLLGADARSMFDGSSGAEPAIFVVRRMNMDFIRPGLMDDLLLVETRVREIGGASITLQQTIVREGKRIFEADVTIVLISKSGKPLRLSERVRSAFEAHRAATAL